MVKKCFKRIWALAPIAAALCTLPAAALEDIDLYAGTGGGIVAPNVLFFLDNTANWAANSNKWTKTDALAKCSLLYTGAKKSICDSYASQIFGTDANLVQGQVEVRTLKLVLNEIHCNQSDPAKKLNLNVGMMLFNAAGTVESSSGSGYVRHAIKPMDPAQCQSPAPAGANLTDHFIADLDAISADITNPAYKIPASADYGSLLYEAFKYFGGYSNPANAPGGSAGGSAGVAGSPANATHFGPIRYSAKTAHEDPAAFTDASRSTYKSAISDGNSCGNNYIITLGNQFPNQEYGTDQNASPPSNSVMSRLGHAPNQLYSVSNKSNIRFADEWAQFLYKTDVSSAPGKQNVRMFAIDVFNAAVDSNQSALLKSMANAGQGTSDNSGYFLVGGDVFALVTALKNILTQIASVNSVFASASLPVSVNAQGTYLNQVFMGVFRPDEDARQRWAGNLKQYQFGVSGSSLFLAGEDGSAAVDSANTGFLQNCAASFWTRDSSNYWEFINGVNSSCSTSTQSLFSDLPDGPIVERGGAGQRLRTLGHASRNIKTCSAAGGFACGIQVDFKSTTTGLIASLAGASGLLPADAATLLNWTRGQNTGDGNPDVSGSVINYNNYASAGLTSASTRPTVHGEVVHSTPLAINYGSGSTNDVVVFYGGGDGMLRAVNGNQSGTGAGDELWAFIAPEHFNKLNRVRTNSPLISYPNVSTAVTPTPAPKGYFFDGSISGYQDKGGTDGARRLWIYPAMRRGGNMLYAFDASTKPSASSSPTVIWKFGCASPGLTCTGAAGVEKLGQTWSAPTPIRVKGVIAPLVTFGAGYDKCEDDEDPHTACDGVAQGRGVYVMDAESGSSVSANYRYFAMDSTAGRFSAEITAVDVNGDGNTDVLYAVDTRGNVWRINTSNPATGFGAYSGGVASWPAPQKIATVSQWGGSSALSERRKFMYPPSVVALGPKVLVLIGTGDREKPSSTSKAAYVKNRFYSFRDDVSVTTSVSAVVGYTNTATDPVTEPPDLINVTNRTTVALSSITAVKGWFLDLYSEFPYEQVVTTPLTLGGVTYFNTFQAKSDSADARVCGGLGTARGYQVDFQTGVEQLNSNNSYDPEIYLSGGIPPSPVGGLVTVDGKTRPFCIGCAGTTILTPKTPVIKPRPNRKPMYRYERIDTKKIN